MRTLSLETSSHKKSVLIVWKSKHVYLYWFHDWKAFLNGCIFFCFDWGAVLIRKLFRWMVVFLVCPWNAFLWMVVFLICLCFDFTIRTLFEWLYFCVLIAEDWLESFFLWMVVFLVCVHVLISRLERFFCEWLYFWFVHALISRSERFFC